MKIYSQLKTLALLCALPISSAFASRPAMPPRPDALQVKLARIDAMSDFEALYSVLPASQEKSEEWLTDDKIFFENNINAHPEVKELAALQAKISRLNNKYWVTHKALEACHANNNHKQLQAQMAEFEAQSYALEIDAGRYCSALQVPHHTMPTSVYSYVVRKLTLTSKQASILLAQNETEKAQSQQRESQWQQEKQSLLAELARFKLPEDGPQEGPIFHEESE